MAFGDHSCVWLVPLEFVVQLSLPDPLLRQVPSGEEPPAPEEDPLVSQ
jgi:hypothetical protein